MTTARDILRDPGLLTVKQAQFLAHAGVAGEAGLSIQKAEDLPFVVDLIKLGFVYYNGNEREVRVYLTSTGEYVREITADRVAAIVTRPFRVLRVLQGGKV